MPVDAEANDAGNLRLINRGALPPIAEVLTAPTLFDRPEGSAVRYMPHHATCPSADSFRRTDAKKKGF